MCLLDSAEGPRVAFGTTVLLPGSSLHHFFGFVVATFETGSLVAQVGLKFSV